MFNDYDDSSSSVNAKWEEIERLLLKQLKKIITLWTN